MSRENTYNKADEIHKIIGKNGVEYLIAQIGLYAYEVLQQKLIVDEAEFELPVEVKQQLSAGEKQIFIMALYQALSQLNKINVPYIVDTPFARIDKEHRGKILSQFFKKLNGQIIILSTDEEIVGDYRESISDIVSNTFVLNHTTNGNILAEDTDMDARDYQLLRGRSVREVQSTNGRISFKEALDFQKTV